jgi:hypothetical protein
MHKGGSIGQKLMKLIFNYESINKADNKCLVAWDIIKKESGNFFKLESPLPLITPEQFNDHYINIGKEIVRLSKPEDNNVLSHEVFLK